MKNPHFKLPGAKLTVAFVLLLGAAAAASGQTFSLDWATLDGGGGTSTGGLYAVTGTIGQPDAGAAMSSGPYSLTGGFWSLIATVPMPGAPRLSIRLTGDELMVYWPSPSTGFMPQVNSSLATTNWVTPAETVQDDGSIKYLLVTPSAGSRFYRLKKP